MPQQSGYDSRPLFLIGYMGCGKTTLGRAVARATGLDFIDLDAYIENRYHRSISALFAEHGEEGFRRIERSLLHEVADFENVIVACGGGTPCFFDNIEFMNSKGTTIFLQASQERIYERLCKARHKRPLIAVMSDDEIRRYVSDALGQRMPYYSRASLVFASDMLEDRRQIDDSVGHFLDIINYDRSRSAHTNI